MDKRLRQLSLLRCFDAAARKQSYSAAAKELAISQAAVSQQIRSLEQNLQVKLFVRSGRSMILTKQGTTLADYVSKALELVSTGFDQIQVEPEEGTLTVTTTLSFASIWLVPRLWRFSETHPNIMVKVMISPKLEDLVHSEIDIAIRQGDPNKADVFQEILFVDPVVPICAPQLIKDANLSTPDKLNKCRLIEVENAGRFNWQSWFTHAGAAYRPNTTSWIEASSWEMALNSVMDGNGACLVPSMMATDLIERQILVQPFNVAINPGVTFSFLYDQDSPRMARIKVFRHWLKEELGSSFTNSDY